MSYSVEYINCKICGSDSPKLLGLRGNLEYVGAPKLSSNEEHMVTNIVKCRKCGFVYTTPLIISNSRKGYDDPNGYLSSTNIEPNVLFEFTLNLIERYTDKGKILDVGCGKGEFLAVAKQRGWDTYGLEPSINLANYASEKYGLNIKLFSLKDVCYPESFFDVVTLNMVLEHVDEPRDLIFEIRRILKNKGLIFVEVPNMDSLMLKIATLYFRLKGRDWSSLLSPLHYPFHYYGYNASSLRYLLATQAFSIKKLLIRDSNLRGFRLDTGGTDFEKFTRAIVTTLAGLMGKGDILIAIAEKS